jgi:hypothetical protein
MAVGIEISGWASAYKESRGLGAKIEVPGIQRCVLTIEVQSLLLVTDTGIIISPNYFTVPRRSGDAGKESHLD